MSKSDKLFMVLVFIFTLGLGVIFIPRLQQYFTGKLYKTTNRTIASNDDGPRIVKKH